MSGLIYPPGTFRANTLSIDEIVEQSKAEPGEDIVVMTTSDLNKLMENKMKTYKITISHTDGSAGATVKFGQATDIKIVKEYYSFVKPPSKVYIEELKTEVIDEKRKEKLNHLMQLFNEKIEEVNMLQDDIRGIRERILEIDSFVPLIFP